MAVITAALGGIRGAAVLQAPITLVARALALADAHEPIGPVTGALNKQSNVKKSLPVEPADLWPNQRAAVR